MKKGRGSKERYSEIKERKASGRKSYLAFPLSFFLSACPLLPLLILPSILSFTFLPLLSHPSFSPALLPSHSFTSLIYFPFYLHIHPSHLPSLPFFPSVKLYLFPKPSHVSPSPFPFPLHFHPSLLFLTS